MLKMKSRVSVLNRNVLPVFLVLCLLVTSMVMFSGVALAGPTNVAAGKTITASDTI